MMKQILLPYYTKLAFVLIVLICIVYIAIMGKDIMAPLVFSFLFAMLLLPVTRFLQGKLRFPRAAAAMTAVILFTAVIGCIIYLVAMQISSLTQDWPVIKTQTLQSVGQLHR